MKNQNKKQIAIASGIAAAMFIAPLVVFAVIYSSDPKTNQFAPADANVQIEEKASTADTQTQTYTFPAVTDTNGNYGVDKAAAVEEKNNPNGEYLRVRFVPTWYKDGMVCAGLDGDIADFRTATLDESDSEHPKLLFKNGKQTPDTIVTLYLNNGWSDEWEYKGDGVFESTVQIKSGNGKKELLKKVELSKDIYDKAKTAELELHVDVLADAIQSITVNGQDTAPRWNDNTP